MRLVEIPAELFQSRLSASQNTGKGVLQNK